MIQQGVLALSALRYVRSMQLDPGCMQSFFYAFHAIPPLIVRVSIQKKDFIRMRTPGQNYTLTAQDRHPRRWSDTGAMVYHTPGCHAPLHGSSAPFRWWRCTIIRGQATLLERRTHKSTSAFIEK